MHGDSKHVCGVDCEKHGFLLGQEDNARINLIGRTITAILNSAFDVNDQREAGMVIVCIERVRAGAHVSLGIHKVEMTEMNYNDLLKAPPPASGDKP